MFIITITVISGGKHIIIAYIFWVVKQHYGFLQAKTPYKPLVLIRIHLFSHNKSCTHISFIYLSSELQDTVPTSIKRWKKQMITMNECRKSLRVTCESDLSAMTHTDRIPCFVPLLCGLRPQTHTHAHAHCCLTQLWVNRLCLDAHVWTCTYTHNWQTEEIFLLSHTKTTCHNLSEIMKLCSCTRSRSKLPSLVRSDAFHCAH